MLEGKNCRIWFNGKEFECSDVKLELNQKKVKPFISGKLIPSNKQNETLMDKLNAIDTKGKSVLELCHEVNNVLSPMDRIRTHNDFKK